MDRPVGVEAEVAQAVAKAAPGLAYVGAMGAVFPVRDSSRHDDDVIMIEQSITDEERLQFAEQELRPFGDEEVRAGQHMIYRIVEGREGEPDDPWVAELGDDLRFSYVRGDQEEPFVSIATVEVLQVRPQLLASEGVGDGLDLEPVGEVRRDSPVRDRAATTRRLVDERHHLKGRLSSGSSQEFIEQ